MPEYIISGIPVHFPFEPYDVQKAYMAKVIECLNNGTNGVLESPTGTGKTLCLLCSTLAWVLNKKAEIQKQQPPSTKIVDGLIETLGEMQSTENNLLDILNDLGGGRSNSWQVPKIIYASRTHSQLSQAMQELKRTSYSFMRAVVLGSRDQLCIHPEVSKETNNASKIQMCKIRITTHTCYFYHKVEKNKNSPLLKSTPVLDIEDLVKIGRKLSMCPYFTAKEVVQEADITFMPYNYLLDPKARQANKVDLNNTIVILDEAHNVEKMCEESASIQIKSSDIATAIDDVTHVMKDMSENNQHNYSEDGKDLSLEDLALLKEMLLELEKAMDAIEVPMKIEGATFPGEYMFELLAKANIVSGNFSVTNRLLEALIQYLAVKAAENKSAFTKGAGLQTLSDLLTIVFSGKEEDRGKVFRCFKVHVEIEEQKTTKSSAKKDGWITTKATFNKITPKILNYWCFNPGFGMEQLLGKNVRSIILTSGTLAPLKPLIAELGIPIAVRLENPHIVDKSQVCVKIVTAGPDKVALNSSYRNRDNPKYISSLGRTILSFCPVIPDGLLIFFPSYPLMNKCIDSWQESGIWAQISRHKPIFVEPRSKDAFNTTMNDFYANINDPTTKGACFIAVCRGKVSEGLDFADVNGRAVVITGLPFPPLKDPRVVLKKKYLEDNRTVENELLSGDGWYSLEATRAVNQAIGRVIRHKNDYGAILLCDERFNYSSQKSQLSAWIQQHMLTSQQHSSFGPLIGEVSRFFRNAEKIIPQPALRECKPLESSTLNSPVKVIDKQYLEQSRNKFKTTHEHAIKIEKANAISAWSPADYSSAAGTSTGKTPSAMDFMSRLDTNISTIDFNIKSENFSQDESSDSLVTIHKRNRGSNLQSAFGFENSAKKKKLKIVENNFNSNYSGYNLSSSSSSQLSGASTSSSISNNSVELKSNLVTNSIANNDDMKTIPTDRTTLLKVIKGSVPAPKYSIFVKALMAYQNADKFDELVSALFSVFGDPHLHYLLKGMRRFIKQVHKQKFDDLISEYLTIH